MEKFIDSALKEYCLFWPKGVCAFGFICGAAAGFAEAYRKHKSDVSTKTEPSFIKALVFGDENGLIAYPIIGAVFTSLLALVIQPLILTTPVSVPLAFVYYRFGGKKEEKK